MTAILIGLRLAVVVLYLAKLLTYQRGNACRIDRLRQRAWLCVAIGTACFGSPDRLATMLGHPFPSIVSGVFQTGFMALMLAGAMLWAAARGYARGGSDADVRKGAYLNLAVIAACLGVAGALR